MYSHPKVASLSTQSARTTPRSRSYSRKMQVISRLSNFAGHCQNLTHYACCWQTKVKGIPIKCGHEALALGRWRFSDISPWNSHSGCPCQMGQLASMRGAGVVCGKSSGANFQWNVDSPKTRVSHPFDFENSDWYFWQIIGRALLACATMHHMILHTHHLHIAVYMHNVIWVHFRVFWICPNWMAHPSSWLLPKCSMLLVFEYRKLLQLTSHLDILKHFKFMCEKKNRGLVPFTHNAAQ